MAGANTRERSTMKAASDSRSEVEKKDVPSIYVDYKLELDGQSGCLSLWAPEISGGFTRKIETFAKRSGPGSPRLQSFHDGATGVLGLENNRGDKGRRRDKEQDFRQEQRPASEATVWAQLLSKSMTRRGPTQTFEEPL